MVTGGAAGPGQAAGAGRGLLLLVLGLTLVLLGLDGFLYLRLSQLGRQTELLLHGGLLHAGLRSVDQLTYGQAAADQVATGKSAGVVRRLFQVSC